MPYDAAKAAFDRDGYVVVRQLLPAGEFRELLDHLDRYIREVVPGLPATHAFYQDRARPETLKQLQNMGVDPYFAAYRRHPRWVEAAAALLGEPVQAKEPEWFAKPPGTEHPTPPHQDNYYFNLAPPQVLTMWMALDPIDDENGCLRYVAGSHLRGVRPHGATQVLGFSQGISDFGPDDEAREAAIHLQPGDVAIHHGNTIHRADPNRSAARPRRAFALVFQGASARRDEEGFRRYSASMATQHAALGVNSS